MLQVLSKFIWQVVKNQQEGKFSLDSKKYISLYINFKKVFLI